MSNRFPADDEHLHPYPGNLKHHKVDKEEQRKLLCEMMKDDAKSGLYDERKREPLLSDEDAAKMAFLGQERYGKFITLRSIALVIRDFYEAARDKDAELIQRLVYWLHRVKSLPDVDADERCWMGDDALAAAAAAGFKPSEP